MNEKVFIVCVEINRIASKNRLEQILSNISSTKIKIVDGVYAVRSSQALDSAKLRDIISSQMGEQIEVFVTKSSIDASWRLNGGAASWLSANI